MALISSMRQSVPIITSLAIASLALMFPPLVAHALPSGGSVAAGSATIANSGTQTTVTQNTSKTVINWTGFNTAAGETVQFIQPSSTAIALNRISGGTTGFNGSLLANGNVWLINPDGMLFGKNATINVGGLLATTSTIADSDFMSGNYNFIPGGNPNAAIINNGSITVNNGGTAALVAPNVFNNGTITAPLGQATLASADSYTVDLYGDGLVSLATSDAVTAQQVRNSGIIRTDGGHVTLTSAAGGNVLDNVINMDGLIQADSVNGQAGSVSLTGADKTSVSGSISAQGGSVETSGNSLSVTGTVIAKHWLLDPNNVTISSGSDTNVTGNPNFTTTNDSAIVSTGSIDTALNNGTSVTIATGSAGTNSQAGDIEVASSISKTAGGDASLTLEAYRNIAIDGGVQIASTSGKLNVTLDANDANAGSGAILMNSGSGITSNGGNIVLGGGTTPLTGSAVSPNGYGIDLESATLQGGGGNITLNGTSLDNTTNIAAGVLLDSSTVETSGTGTITIHGIGGNTSGDAGTIFASNGVWLQSSALASGAGAININGTGGNSGPSTSIGIEQVFGSISSATGSVNLTGQSDYGYGILLAQGAVNSTGATSGATLNLNGTSTAPSQYYSGIYLEHETISSISGNISLSGNGGTTATGIQLSENSGNTLIQSTGTGLNAATISLTGSGVNGVSIEGTTLSSVDGNIAVTGQGTGAGNFGVQLVGSTQIQGTGSAGITLTGTGNSGATGIAAEGNGTITNSLSAANINLNADTLNFIINNDTPPLAANILISATTALTLTPLTTAISIAADASGNAIISNSAGSIEIAGNIEQAGAGNLTLSANNNIAIDSGAQITSTSGKLNVTLDANDANAGSGAISMASGSGISSNGGNIILAGGALSNSIPTGFAIGNATYNNGIVLDNVTLNAGGGSITLKGSGYSSSATDSNGVEANSNSLIETSGSGNISLTGNGGSSTGTNGDSNIGVSVSDTDLTTNNGNITITGIGGTRGSGSQGVNGISDGGISLGGTLEATGNGSILLNGTGGSGNGSGNTGISNSGTIQTNGSGSINITGTGGSGDSVIDSAGNLGVNNNGNIRTTGSGNIIINATGGNGNYVNSGESNTGLYNNDLIEATGSGNIIITGIGGTGNSGPFNQGIDNEGTIRTTGGSSLSLTGIGGTGNSASNQGIYNQAQFGNSFIGTTAGGNIILTGVEGHGTGSQNTGIVNQDTVSAADGGNLTAIANSMSWNGAETSASNITFKPYTAGTTMGIGSGAGTLNIGDATLGALTYDSLTLGGSDTGAMNINSNTVFAGSVLFQTGSGHNITLDGQIISSSAGTAFTLVPGGNFINTAGANALMPGANGRFLVYSPPLARNTLDGISFDFILHGCSYGSPCPSLPDTGNGLILSDVPFDSIPETVQQTLFLQNLLQAQEYTKYIMQSYFGDTPAAPVYIDASLAQSLGLDDNGPHRWWNGIIH